MTSCAYSSIFYADSKTNTKTEVYLHNVYISLEHIWIDKEDSRTWTCAQVHRFQDFITGCCWKHQIQDEGFTAALFLLSQGLLYTACTVPFLVHLAHLATGRVLTMVVGCGLSTCWHWDGPEQSNGRQVNSRCKCAAIWWKVPCDAHPPPAHRGNLMNQRRLGNDEKRLGDDELLCQWADPGK